MNFLQKTKTYIGSHKTASIVILIVLLLIGYWGYKKLSDNSGETRYLTGVASRGNIISSISGSGQVSASSSINLSPKSSGTVTYVAVSPGDKVKEGQLLFAVDSTSAQKAVRDAEANLKAARLDLETAKAQNQNTDINQSTAVKNAYNNLLNSTLTAVPDGASVNTSTSLTPPAIGGNYSLGKEGQIKIHFYASTGGISFIASGLVNGSGTGNSNIATPIGDSGLTLTMPTNYNLNGINDWVVNIPNKNASNYLSNYNSYLSALEAENQQNSDSVLNKLSLEAKELALSQKENSLLDAKENLENYYVRAPFNGTIATVSAQKGDNPTGTFGTLITESQLATISLNEVDVAKIALGQKATLTFDAISDLTITGKVTEIDPVGTVSQGVVSYSVKIGFDSSDARIKPGMTANASIITDMRQNVLLVPTSAIKTNNGKSYVQVFGSPLPAAASGIQGSSSASLPKSKLVEIGIADDKNTEIISGLNEGEVVVTKTISGTTKSTSSAPSLFGGGENRGVKNSTRIGG